MLQLTKCLILFRTPIDLDILFDKLLMSFQATSAIDKDTQVLNMRFLSYSLVSNCDCYKIFQMFIVRMENNKIGFTNI